VVKWADTEKERQARKVQKAQAVSSPPIPGQQPSLFGAVPMGYVPAPPPYNGYSYQVLLYHNWHTWFVDATHFELIVGLLFILL
jgi:hypothetical protein